MASVTAFANQFSPSWYGFRAGLAIVKLSPIAAAMARRLKRGKPIWKIRRKKRPKV